jgi:hypothetical protein
MKTTLAILLVLGGLAFAPLTIGAFAHANPDALPPEPIGGLVRLIRDAEGGISSLVMSGLRNNPFERGFAYMGVTILLTAVASALLADTRSQTLARPGRRGA